MTTWLPTEKSVCAAGFFLVPNTVCGVIATVTGAPVFGFSVHIVPLIAVSWPLVALAGFFFPALADAAGVAVVVLPVALAFAPAIAVGVPRLGAGVGVSTATVGGATLGVIVAVALGWLPLLHALSAMTTRSAKAA